MVSVNSSLGRYLAMDIISLYGLAVGFKCGTVNSTEVLEVLEVFGISTMVRCDETLADWD
jgi:hypothetical protein